MTPIVASLRAMLARLLPFLLLGIVGQAAQAADPEAHRTGFFEVTFSERSPLSAYERMAARYGWGDQRSGSQYRLEEEPYGVHVPPAYDGSEPWGLIVYTDAGNTGQTRKYPDLMAKHKLIWIGGTKVGNERDIVVRYGVMLDAVHNMTRLYNIDPDRIYACGLSGGGRCASMVAPMYADVFSGGIYLIGCNEPRFPRNERELEHEVRALALQDRYALITGSEDFNKPGTQRVHKAYQGHGFEHVTYLEEPGLDHSFPSDEWFAQGLAAVDGPLITETETWIAQAEQLEASKPLLAYRLYERAAKRSIAADAAAQAKAALPRLRAEINEQLQPDLERMLKRPRADQLREWAAEWADFPVAERARQQAGALVDEALAEILALDTRRQRRELEDFVRAWEGYPAHERAVAAYDELAEPELREAMVEEDPDRRLRALQGFIENWRPCPSTERARAAIDEVLSEQLDTILALEDPRARGRGLVGIIKRYPGTDAAARAQSEVEKLKRELQR